MPEHVNPARDDVLLLCQVCSHVKRAARVSSATFSMHRLPIYWHLATVGAPPDNKEAQLAVYCDRARQCAYYTQTFHLQTVPEDPGPTRWARQVRSEPRMAQRA